MLMIHCLNHQQQLDFLLIELWSASLPSVISVCDTNKNKTTFTFFDVQMKNVSYRRKDLNGKDGSMLFFSYCRQIP